MKSLKRSLFLVAALSLPLSWSSAEAMRSDCGYEESDPEGGGFSYCIHSWCGSNCQAVDCVYANGSEYHWISPGCGVAN